MTFASPHSHRPVQPPRTTAPRTAASRFAAARSTYESDSVQMVTPNQLLVMIYDALLRHLDVASTAIDSGDLSLANDRLTKSQALLFELEKGLDVTAWPAGASLAQLYDFLGNELVTANVTKDTARIATCRDLIAPLAEAWRQAAQGLAAQELSTASSPAHGQLATVGR